MTIGMAGPALIEGTVGTETDIKDMIRLAPGNGVTAMRIHYPGEPPADLETMADTSSIRIELLSSGLLRPGVESRIDGIVWEPRYEWSFTGRDCLFEGLVVIGNRTGQTWNTRSISVVDESRHIAATTTAELPVPEGPSVVRWWQSPGRVLDPHLIYGWPRLGRWNLMWPCVLQSPGPVIHPAGEMNVVTLPARTGDTLWIEAGPEDGLALYETMENGQSSIAGAVLVESSSLEALSIIVRYPSVLPRGALFRAGEGLADSIYLQPKETRILHYSIVYPTSAAS